jgi:uncharacterized protein (DUF934 family)
MPLVKQGHIVEDRYVRVLDDAPIPDGVPAIVTADRFLADAAGLAARLAPVGVLWPNNRKVVELEPWLGRLALIALTFPKFRDGRAYSQARLLRERYGFRGELRATGEILRDQFLFLIRAGFDSLEVTKAADAEAFAAAVSTYSVFYQPSTDGRLAVRRRRVAQQMPAPGRDTQAADPPTFERR